MTFVLIALGVAILMAVAGQNSNIGLCRKLGCNATR